MNTVYYFKGQSDNEWRIGESHNVEQRIKQHFSSNPYILPVYSITVGNDIHDSHIHDMLIKEYGCKFMSKNGDKSWIVGCSKNDIEEAIEKSLKNNNYLNETFVRNQIESFPIPLTKNKNAERGHRIDQGVMNEAFLNFGIETSCEDLPNLHKFGIIIRKNEIETELTVSSNKDRVYLGPKENRKNRSIFNSIKNKETLNVIGIRIKEQLFSLLNANSQNPM